MQTRIVLSRPEDFTRAKTALVSLWQHRGGELHELLIKEYENQRSIEQNAKFHALCGDISKQKTWCGEHQSTEDWKRLLVDAWMKATGRKIKMLPSLDGNGYTTIYQQTSKLGVKNMAELIEYTIAWCVDNNIRFYEYRMEDAA